MTFTFDMLPSGDVENDGWTLVASSATKVWEVLSAFDDDCYVRCPSYRGGIEVSFPIDVGDLPEGAIIDSVTVFIRMKAEAGSGPRTVAVNVLSKENRSRYTTRTLRATSSIQTFEVGTYTKDPLGRAWDIHRLNKLRLRVFSHNNLFDSIRIYALYVRINYHTRPSATVTSPSGTVNTPSPLIEWLYRQGEGEIQKSAEFKIFTLQQTTSTTFNPDTAPPVYAGTTNGISTSLILPTTLNNNDYKIYIRVKSWFGSISVWVSKQFKISAPSPGVPGDNNAGIAGVPGVGTPTVVPDNYTSSAAIRMQDTSNLLSVQQADFEIASDPLGYVGSNATLTRDTTQAFAEGVASMKIAASSAADASAVSTPVEVQPGKPMTVRAQFLAATTARTVSITARFYDDTWTLLGTTITASGTDASTTWTEVVANGTSPADAKYCEVVAKVTSPANAEAHHVDHVGLMYGTDTAWSDGGHASRNLLTSFLATGDDPASATDSWTQANSASTTTRVTATGTGAHGAKCHQMSYVGVSPSISFRATGTVFTTPTTGTNFTLNKPATVQNNDLMLAFVTSTEHGGINPPSGWTTVNTASIDDGSTDIALWVLKRTATSSDPSSWATGTVTTASSRRTAVVVAYSGAAHADEQFIADAVRTDGTGNLVHQTATVVNTDSNAWRVSAFAASDDVSGGTFTANKNSPTVAPNIAYVGRATHWAQTSDTLSFTINKPAGVQSGDLMVAAALFSGEVSGTPTLTGWTQVRKTVKLTNGNDDRSGTTTLIIWRRTAGSSEPNSWTGTHNDYGWPKITQVVAYRNVDTSNPFITETASSKTNASSLSTGSVTNTNSKAWRMTVFGAATPTQNSWNSNADVSERADNSTSLTQHPDTVLGMFDSNGMISTGSHSRTGSISSDSFYSAIAWIGILRPLSSAPAPGTNESERVDNANGSSNPWMSTAVYDSGGTVGTGQHSVYGQMAPGSGSESNSMASWIGIIRPAASVQAGTVAAYTNTMIDISEIDDSVLDLAKHKLTMMAAFKGSTEGTPTLTAEFYRANHLISKQSATGRTFDTTSFTKSWAVFDVPTGTTRIRPVVSALERAVSDTVQFDQVGVMLGALDPAQEPTWRNGTARPEHPVWSRPVIEYQENDGSGYGPWKLLAGQKARPPAYDLATGEMLYVDHTIIPLHQRRYRVATLSYGLNGDFYSSGFGPVSEEANFEPRAWWLKDIQDLSKNMQVVPKWKDYSTDTTNMATTFQPLGEDYPIVISEGFKGDTFTLELHCEQTEFTALMALLNSRRTLILQSDIDQMWWVRPVGNIQANVLATNSRQLRPRRYVTVTFAQVAPEE